MSLLVTNAVVAGSGHGYDHWASIDGIGWAAHGSSRVVGRNMVV